MKKLLLFFVILSAFSYVSAAVGPYEQMVDMDNADFKEAFRKAKELYLAILKQAKQEMPFLEKGRYIYDLDFKGQSEKERIAREYNRALERYQLAQAVYKASIKDKKLKKSGRHLDVNPKDLELAFSKNGDPIGFEKLVEANQPKGSLSLKERWKLFKLQRKVNQERLSPYDIAEYVNLKRRSASPSIMEKIELYFLKRKIKNKGLAALTTKERKQYEVLCEKKSDYKEVS